MEFSSINWADKVSLGPCCKGFKSRGFQRYTFVTENESVVVTWILLKEKQKVRASLSVRLLREKEREILALDEM